MRRHLLLATATGLLVGLSCADRNVKEGPDVERICADLCSAPVGCPWHEGPDDIDGCVESCATGLYWDECPEENALYYQCRAHWSCDDQKAFIDGEATASELPCWEELQVQNPCFARAIAEDKEDG